MTYPTVDGAFDIPAPTDYEYYDVMRLGDATIQIPEELVHRHVASYDQSKDNNPDTTYACTRYGTTHSINENNAIEGSNIVTEPVPEWFIAITEYGAILDKGDSLRSALIQARDRKLISGYAVCKDTYQMKFAIASGQNLYTGTTKCNWKKTRETGIFTPGTGYGHAFAVIGYKKEGLIGLNSYGDKYNYKGYVGCFLIKWEDVPNLFTVYALIDESNIDELQKEKIRQDELSKKRMKDMGIRNGLREGDPVTREEVVLMLDRLYQNTGGV